ncbi:hypothetical protein KUTeg_004295 [Tegillarca granosa]|uniref:CSD domain-containing protein n=1 Tax=Tegillarca granosa TaxID=220873 RepID=A0ABQ9FPJ0_TEGGR|nr:hypothetical protein KUTeg_004295 [Tegillarca granosa]
MFRGYSDHVVDVLRATVSLIWKANKKGVFITKTRRQSEKAKQGPVFKGTVKSFCRQKGHGFIIPEGEAAPVFVHISDIEGEFVPLEGDEVTYNLCKIPPKMEKEQAVHVKIDKLKPGETHYRWDSSPVTPPQ